MNGFDTFTKIADNVANLGKIIVATSFEWLPKVQKIAQSGHTADNLQLYNVFEAVVVFAIQAL